MHPDQAIAVAHGHRADLHRQAEQHRLATRTEASVATSTWRRRTGWWLVAVGLRLAVGRRRPVLARVP